MKSGRLLDPGGNFFSIFCFSSFRLVQQMPFLKPGSDLSNFVAWTIYKRLNGFYIEQVLQVTSHTSKWHGSLSQLRFCSCTFSSWSCQRYAFTDFCWSWLWSSIVWSTLKERLTWFAVKIFLRYLPNNFGTALLWRPLLIFSKIVRIGSGLPLFPISKIGRRSKYRLTEYVRCWRLQWSELYQP